MITRRKFKTVMRKVRRQRQIKEPEKEEIKEKIFAEPEKIEALPNLEEEFEKNVDFATQVGGDRVFTYPDCRHLSPSRRNDRHPLRHRHSPGPGEPEPLRRVGKGTRSGEGGVVLLDLDENYVCERDETQDILGYND